MWTTGLSDLGTDEPASEHDRGRVKTVLSYGRVQVASRCGAPLSQALIASIRGFVPSTAITRFML